MLNNVLMGIQLVLALFLMLVIMPQEGKGNFSSEYAGEEGSSQAYFKPRGKQAFFLKSTKIAAALFFINAVALLVANK